MVKVQIPRRNATNKWNKYFGYLRAVPWSLATPQTYSTAKQEHSNVFYSWFIWSIQTSFLYSGRKKKQWQKHTYWAIICMAYIWLTMRGRIWGKNVGMLLINNK